MPISVALPSPDIEFFSDLMYPYLGVNDQIGANAAPGNNNVRCRSRVQQGEVTVAPISTSGGVGVVGPNFSGLGGRVGALVTTTAAQQGTLMRPDTWSPAWDSTVFNDGALLEPSAVVAVWDVHVALTSSLFVGTADMTGFVFTPLRPLQVDPATGAPGGSNAQGGFGIYANDDGGGNNQWEFVSYDSTPTILQRTVIPSSAVADVTDWNAFRFTIISAGPNRPATLSLEANSAGVVGVQGLQFGTAALPFPNTLQADASGYCFGQSLSPALGGAGYHFSVYARFGRFTAGGEEIQGI